MSNMHLVSAAVAAGFAIKSIKDGEITWLGAAPNAGEIAAIMLAAKRLEVRDAVVQDIERLGGSLVAKYPRTEQQGWTAKFQEATAVDAGDLAPGDAYMLGIEAGITGETVAALATASLTAASLTGMIPAITAGLRRRLEAGTEAAADEAALDALQASVDPIRTAIMTAFASGDPATVQTALAAL